MTGRTIVSGNCLQENLAKSVTCRFCHSDVTLLENVFARSGLGSSVRKTPEATFDTACKL